MKKRSILLVEGDAVIAKIYKEYFMEFGYDVRISSDAQGGIDLLDQQVPDVVVLEIQLSGHNGYEFLYEMRSYAEWHGIPVVINSSIPQQASNLNELKMRELKVSAYLYKPNTTLRHLNSVIEKQLQPANPK